MGLFGKLRGKKKERRVVFIGLDGTPYTFMQRLIAEGRAPNAARLAGQGSLLRMESVWPWVSSAAWSTMMTGVNPGKHGIFGFVDRDPATYKQFIPTSRHMKARTLWEVLSDAGKLGRAENITGSVLKDLRSRSSFAYYHGFGHRVFIGNTENTIFCGSVLL